MVKFDYEFIEKVCDVLNGDRGENYPSNSDFQKYGIPFVNAGHLQEGSIDFSKMDYITAEQYNRMGGAKLQKGDILYCLRGSLGKFAIYPRDGGAPASSLAVIRCGISLDTNFLFQILGSNIINEQIMTENNGSSQPNLSATSLKNFKIPLPPLPEQRAIATVLSDMDDYIATLEQLIAKKRNIKKGAMQELLTGKRRLPGFAGEWEEKELYEIAEFYDNFRIPITESKRESGSVPYYGANGIQGYVKGYTHDGEFVLIAEDGANDLYDYPVIYINGKVWVNNHAHVIQGIPGRATTKYLSYALKNVDFVEILVGGTRAKLNGSAAKKIKIKVPHIKEQNAITTILSDMDAEIDALETKLKKARNIKQGMMEELLTGHIRLIEDEIDNVSNE